VRTKQDCQVAESHHVNVLRSVGVCYLVGGGDCSLRVGAAVVSLVPGSRISGDGVFSFDMEVMRGRGESKLF
nr:ORF [Tobacco ringspot virus satellite RNA]